MSFCVMGRCPTTFASITLSAEEDRFVFDELGKYLLAIFDDFFTI